tara:strand:+ start:287 stop:1138 length:852 start_codon:yes stop_codon:yes gene_type:complete
MKNILGVFNGKFQDLDKIKVSPLSRAYTFSDSVYEVIPFYNNKIIAFEKHINRLSNSCDALNIKSNISLCSDEILHLISTSKLKNGYVYYQISRGVDALRSHIYDTSLEVETFGYIVDYQFESKDLKVSLCEDIRWQRCDIKSTSLLGNVMSMNQSKNNHCDEVIMHKDGELTEGGASNVFFVIEGNIYTPSLSSNILPGITRELLISESNKNGIYIEEGKYSVNDLLQAESIWLTSSTKCLGQVIEIIGYETKIELNNEVFQKCNKIFKNAFLSGQLNNNII